MKSLLVSLILILTVSTLSVAYPTTMQVENVWDSAPHLIVGMVQKLYVIEHSDPILDIPALSIVETVDSEVIVSYMGPLTIDIGEVPNSLSYEITLEPSDVTVAKLPESARVSPWLYIAGGVVLFLGGVVTGFISSR